MKCVISSLIVLAIFLIPLILSLWIVQCNGKHPAVLIPGYFGSRIEAIPQPGSSGIDNCCVRDTNWTIWLDEIQISHSTSYESIFDECWVNNMRLHYDNVTHTTYDAPGVHLKAEFGQCSSVEWLHPNDTWFKTVANSPFKGILNSYQGFNKIVEKLVQNGYETDKNIVGAAFDFRKAPNELQDYFKNLKELIEETSRKNGNTVVLIAHSMGCPNTLLFLHQQTQAWKDQYIKALIGLAGGWGGCTIPVQAFSEGSDFRLGLVPASTLRKVVTTYPATSWQFPRTPLWSKDEVLVSTCSKNYTLGNLEEFFYILDFPEAWEMYKDNYKYTTNLDAPGVDVHCLSGFGVDTIDSIWYSGTLTEHGDTEYKYGDGDGTINRRSLDVCKLWVTAQSNKVFIKEYKGFSHTDILQDDVVTDYIARVCTGCE